MALPSGGTTNFFGDLVDTIYSNHENNCAELINSVYDSLVDESPVDTGALRANWAAGITPNSNYIEQPSPKTPNSVPFVPRKAKTYGVKRQYFIWNNTPYLSYVNAGIAGRNHTVTPKSSKNIDFVQRGIAIGVAKAQGKV